MLFSKIYKYYNQDPFLGNEIYGPKNVALSTNISLPDIVLKAGDRYFTTVYAFNPLGMVVFSTSDGVVADHDIPIKGSVFTNFNYMDQEFHSSLVKASWVGFIDRHSYIDEYMYAICPVGETPIFRSVGLHNQVEENIVDYIHGKQYIIHVKAIDAAGHHSEVAISNTFTVDKTEPILQNCKDKIIAFQSQLSCECQPIIDNGFGEYCECSTNDTIDVVTSGMYRLKGETYGEPTETLVRLEIGSHTEWVVFNHARRNIYEFDTSFITSHASTLTPKLMTNYQMDGYMVKIYKCTSVSSDGELGIYQSGHLGVRIIHTFSDEESNIINTQIGIGTNPGGFQLLPLADFGNESTSLIPLPLQHGMTVYSTVIATNNAGLQTVVNSEPLIIDWTAPTVANITVHVKQKSSSSFSINVQWNVFDDKTPVTGCFWSVGKLEIQKNVHICIQYVYIYLIRFSSIF